MLPPDMSSLESRRTAMKAGGAALAVSALASLSAPPVFAADNNTIQVALVGCGGRGTGAATNALESINGPTKLVAMADVFEAKLKGSYKNLTRKLSDKVDVPPERQFLGFDGYKQAIDCLNPGDVVILATPLAFRCPHFAYAIEKGVHVFMEKPLTADGPTTRRIIALGKEAQAKNLKVAVGLMCRHCRARQELFDRIQNGEIGDITLLQPYRMLGPTGSAFAKPQPAEVTSELMYQIDNFHGFLWASGGAFSDFLIHNVDECCWMKDAWPVEAQGVGGRHYREDYVDQNFDSYGVEYTFADGTKMYLGGRTIPGCFQRFASFAHGTKGSAVISASAHTPARCKTYRGHNFVEKDLIWEYGPKESNPYQNEWDDLLAAIRSDTPYSEVERGAIASLVTSMGRMAAHTGQVVTYDEIFNSTHEFAPQVAELTMDSPAPLQKQPNGKYPVPMPGIITKTEF